jgi:methionine sulfoxide reductase catalytic subunit
MVRCSKRRIDNRYTRKHPKMLLKKPREISESEITPESIFWKRRQILQTASAFGATSLIGSSGQAQAQTPSQLQPGPFGNLIKSPYNRLTDEPLTPLKDVIAKTRFRELEENITANAGLYNTSPWTIRVEGEVLKPRTFGIEELLKLAPIEERIYRMRCNEGWSLVIPYNGYPLSEILRRVEPTGNARFVEFTSIHDPANLRGQRDIDYIAWPYVEALRMDEAMHPLSIVALGLYGQLLPKANGAPVAIRIPWKYGTKSPKAVVRIRLTEMQPKTVWSTLYPQYHSFWGNVNAQSLDNMKERRVGDFWKRPTLPFNGYREQVASMYTGLDAKLQF